MQCLPLSIHSVSITLEVDDGLRALDKLRGRAWMWTGIVFDYQLNRLYHGATFHSGPETLTLLFLAVNDSTFKGSLKTPRGSRDNEWLYHL